MNNLLGKLRTVTAVSVLFFFTNITCAEPPNLTLVKNELKKYHDSGRYQQQLAESVEKAQKYISAQAQINQKEKLPQKLAIVLDIDETSLSNYNYMVKHDFSATHEQFHQHIMKANAPPIKPTLTLYKEALKHGITVFFVTGRPESDRPATEKNLTQAGYSQWADIYLRPTNYSSRSIIAFKSNARKIITDKGYTIVASIGDQFSDLKGEYTQRGFKLPNPFYYLP